MVFIEFISINQLKNLELHNFPNSAQTQPMKVHHFYCLEIKQRKFLLKPQMVEKLNQPIKEVSTLRNVQILN